MATFLSILRSRLSVGVGLFGILVLLSGCSRPAETQPVPGQESPPPRARHDTNGSVSVTLDVETRRIMGLETAPLESEQRLPERTAYGRVLDASSLAGLAAELTAALAARDASRAELKRLNTLLEQNNASQRALQAAESAAARDQAQAESVRLRLLAGWGPEIASRPDLPAFAESLSSLQNALVQLEVPAGESLPEPPATARVVTLADEQPVQAHYIGRAPSVSPQTQGNGFLFLVTSNQNHLAPGAAINGFLLLPGEPQQGVMVPRSAIVRFNGATWVYVEKPDNSFERREISLSQPSESGWFVTRNLKPGDKVVTIGGQQLLSEELKSQAAE